jgi:hypothetical protein
MDKISMEAFFDEYIRISQLEKEAAVFGGGNILRQGYSTVRALGRGVEKGYNQGGAAGAYNMGKAMIKGRAGSARGTRGLVGAGLLGAGALGTAGAAAYGGKKLMER